MKFSELPKVYQDKINADIADVYGDEYPEIVAAYKEWEAVSLFEGEFQKEVTEDFHVAVIAFVGGWQAKEKSLPPGQPYINHHRDRG